MSEIYICDTCRYADADGAGHFMCTDYSPPEAGGECWPVANKVMAGEGTDPNAACVAYEPRGEMADGIHDVAKRLEAFYTAEPDPHGQRVLMAIDQLRRDLSGYHGQLKAHNDLAKHCDRQRERIACLEGLYIKVKAENAQLRKKLEFERESNASIRRLFDAVAPRCGKPDCPSLVDYVEKLRELVRIMVYCMQYERECDGCRLNGADGAITDPAGCDGMFDRMRELGIEVG